MWFLLKKLQTQLHNISWYLKCCDYLNRGIWLSRKSKHSSVTKIISSADYYIFKRKKIFLKKLILQKEVIEEILIKNESLRVRCLFKKVIEEILIKKTFFMSNVLWKKVIEEILIKNEFLCVKFPFKEIYQRSFVQK